MSDHPYELPLTSDEAERHDFIIANANHLLLVRVEHEGRPRAALAAVFFEGGTYDVRPVALLVDDDLVAQLNPGPELEKVH